MSPQSRTRPLRGRGDAITGGEEAGSESRISTRRVPSTEKPDLASERTPPNTAGFSGQSAKSASPLPSGEGAEGEGGETRGGRRRGRPRMRRATSRRLIAQARTLKTGQVAEETANLIRRFEWDLFVTLTTKDFAGPELLAKRYIELARRVENADAGLALRRRDLWRREERLRHVVAWEPQRRGVWHLHALWGAPGAQKINRRWVRQEWNRLCLPGRGLIVETAHGVDWLVSRDSPQRGQRKYELVGNADVSLVRSEDNVAAYCAKYVVKGGTVDVHGLA